MTSTNRADALAKLKSRWLWAVAFTVLVVIAGYFFLNRYWPIGATNWVLLSTAVLIYQLAILFLDLDKNISVKTNRLLPAFGPGIWLSLMRLLSLGLLAGFLAAPPPPALLAWLPFGLALIFNLSDLFDGYLARRFGSATVLGAKLDLDLDSRGMLITSLLAVHLGRVGWWFALVGLARYIYVFFTWLRKRFGLRAYALKPSRLRRPFAGVEMGFATALLAPIFSPIATSFATAITVFPFLGNFLFDWFQVTRLSFRIKKACAVRLAKGLPKAFSLVLRAEVLLLLVQRVFALGSGNEYFVFESLAVVALFFGIAGRPVALLALIETCVRLKNHPIATSDYALLFGLTVLIYMGTGAFSIWRPEQFLISGRLGERTTHTTLDLK